MIKIDRGNYKGWIDVWVNGDAKDRKINYVFHSSYIDEEELQYYALEQNIVIYIREYNGFLKIVTFEQKLN